jgi:ADP-dependent phosphofructokinase/glucokinase
VRHWSECYAQLAERVRVVAPEARPVLLSTTVDVDYIYAMTSRRLEALRRGYFSPDGVAAGVSVGVDRLLSEERDGELFWDWPDGLAWLTEALGPEDRVQVGGSGPQAAWALDELGAPAIMALESRSGEQLAVLARNVLVCEDRGLVPVGDLRADPGAAPVRHAILEFAHGTQPMARPVGRAHRIILRFSPVAFERDEQFLSMQPELGPNAGASMLAGLNGLAGSDEASLSWVKRVLTVWGESGPAVRHLELGDTSYETDLTSVVANLRGLYSSLGLSLSELRTFWGYSGDVGAKALGLARDLGCSVVVHADRWSLAVHRTDADLVVRRLMTGNLLASARAAQGAPSSDVAPVSYASYEDDIPESQPLDEGWRIDCVPTPFVVEPASTIGLGDTFAAGLLLAAAVEGNRAWD